MTITVIHGGPATGKTRYAERFVVHYGCTRIVEEWDPRGRERQRTRPGSGDLVLTQCDPDVIRNHLGSSARVISIAEALRAIGGAA